MECHCEDPKDAVGDRAAPTTAQRTRNGTNSRGVSRIYEMSFAGGVWKMWRDWPGFSQRYEAKISQDGDTIASRWEKSSDGQRWEHDFNITYRRKT